MVTTRSCEIGKHAACGGLTATPVLGALLVSTCDCLCHVGDDVLDDALERMLDDSGEGR